MKFNEVYFIHIFVIIFIILLNSYYIEPIIEKNWRATRKSLNQIEILYMDISRKFRFI